MVYCSGNGKITECAEVLNMNKLVYNVRDILTFRDLIGGSAELYGDLCAFTFREGDGVREITYGEAYEDVRAFAAYLNFGVWLLNR